MIDDETRKKIIDMYLKKRSRAHIKKETGTSLPTIRKIIREYEDDDKEITPPDEHSPPEPGDLEARIRRLENSLLRFEEWKQEQEDLPAYVNSLFSNIAELRNDMKSIQNDLDYALRRKFIINLTRNWPWSRNDPWTIMRNGVPIWLLEKVLSDVLDGKGIEIILGKIEAQDTRKVYEVYLGEGWDDITVKKIEKQFL